MVNFQFASVEENQVVLNMSDPTVSSYRKAENNPELARIAEGIKTRALNIQAGINAEQVKAPDQRMEAALQQYANNEIEGVPTNHVIMSDKKLQELTSKSVTNNLT